jgi:tripartite-type tricarboxylate transporter receptor subunit TctC
MLVRILFFLLLAFAAPAVIAQGAAGFPQKPVRLIIPFPPGGSADFLGRLLADKLGAQWGKQVVVENRPGGSTLIGLGAVARAEPDGHIIGMNTAGLIVQPSIRKTMPFNVMEDFAFITRISEAPFFLTVPADFPVRSAAELVAYAKANPGKLNFGSFGIGSTPHLLGETLVLSTGVPMTHVPFKGTSDMITAHLNGQVQVNFDVLQPLLPHIKAGKLRPLLVTASKRSHLLPDVPTAEQAGLPDLNMPTWFGLLAPRQTPPEVVAALNKAVVTALQQPDVAAALDKQGMTLVGDTPEQYRAYAAAAMRQVKKIVEAAKIPPTD